MARSDYEDARGKAKTSRWLLPRLVGIMGSPKGDKAHADAICVHAKSAVCGGGRSVLALLPRDRSRSSGLVAGSNKLARGCRDPVFAPKLREWLKTLRRKNASVLFSTQSLADITRSPVAPAVIESCLSRIFLPNARAIEPESRDAYERLGLNARQIETIARAILKRDYWFQSASGCRSGPWRSPSAARRAQRIWPRSIA